MEEKSTKRHVGGAGALAAIMILVMIVPMVYVLAIGPLVWLNERGHIQVTPTSIVGRLYWPLEWTADKCPPVQTGIGWYVSLWQTPAQSVQIAAPASATAATPVTAPMPVPMPAPGAAPAAAAPAEDAPAPAAPVNQGD